MGMNMFRTIVLLGLAAIVGCVEAEDLVRAEEQQDRPLKPKIEVAGPGQDQSELYYYPPPEDDGGGGGGGVTSVFRSSMGVGGSGAIRDLKFEKDSTSNQTPLGGYHMGWADLNKGAGGAYIYLSFTRDKASVQGNDECGTENEFVTGIKAQDYNWFDAGIIKGNCPDSSSSPTPIWEGVGNYWRHPDLNDGAGGRYIFAWHYKQEGYTPVTEVGVVSGNSSSIQCPSSWIRVEQDLNEGAGGDWIYFCYKQ